MPKDILIDGGILVKIGVENDMHPDVGMAHLPAQHRSDGDFCGFGMRKTENPRRHTAERDGGKPASAATSRQEV